MPERIWTISAAIVLALLLAAPAAQALPGPAHPAQRCELPAQTLPSLRIEVCPACELDPTDIAGWQQAYADAARAAGHAIDPAEPVRVRITETGQLPNGTPYAIGEAAGLRFRVGDPDPGATLGMALGRMSFVILSGQRRHATQETAK